jgi:hypothetical protein
MEMLEALAVLTVRTGKPHYSKLPALKVVSREGKRKGALFGGLRK